MIKAGVKTGLVLRFMRKRWDVPAGTFARVEEVSQAGVPPVWCFRCECLFMDGLVRRSTSSLNLFEKDLADFEPFTGLLPVSPAPQSRRSRGILPKVPSPCLSLPIRPMTTSQTDSTFKDSLSPLIRFGTSTWTYEGWKGQVYKKTYPKSRFKQDSLAEYAAYEYQGERLFRTVGIDHTFYGPPTAKMLAHYAAQLPTGFQACAKVWEEITVPVFPSGLRYAKKAGPNPTFLDASYFIEMVLVPFNEAFREHTGRSS
jgi:hypothetical protein